MPIIERGGEIILGDDSIHDARLTIHYCPFCGEHGWPHRGTRNCECGIMESIVKDFPELMEFELEMNEFHIIHGPRVGKQYAKHQIYYCIACGGNPPPSLRHTFFESPSAAEYDEAWARIAHLKNENDYIREFGEPTLALDMRPPSAKDIEIYGMRPMKKQWTFTPPGSRITYVLYLRADGTYETSLHAKCKEQRKHDT